MYWMWAFLCVCVRTCCQACNRKAYLPYMWRTSAHMAAAYVSMRHHTPYTWWGRCILRRTFMTLQMAQHISILYRHSDTAESTRDSGSLQGRLITYTSRFVAKHWEWLTRDCGIWLYVMYTIAYSNNAYTASSQIWAVWELHMTEGEKKRWCEIMWQAEHKEVIC